MRTRTVSALVAIAVALVPPLQSPGFAAGKLAQYRFDSGKGSNGKTWISVSCYVGGVFVWADGMDCNGNTYFCRPDGGTLRQPTDDPIANILPTHTGATEAGEWRSVILRDAGGVPIAVMGISESGVYYSYECAPASDVRYQ